MFIRRGYWRVGLDLPISTPICHNVLPKVFLGSGGTLRESYLSVHDIGIKRGGIYQMLDHRNVTLYRIFRSIMLLVLRGCTQTI